MHGGLGYGTGTGWVAFSVAGQAPVKVFGGWPSTQQWSLSGSYISLASDLKRLLAISSAFARTLALYDVVAQQTVFTFTVPCVSGYTPALMFVGTNVVGVGCDNPLSYFVYRFNSSGLGLLLATLPTATLRAGRE